DDRNTAHPDHRRRPRFPRGDRRAAGRRRVRGGRGPGGRRGAGAAARRPLRHGAAGSEDGGAHRAFRAAGAARERQRRARADADRVRHGGQRGAGAEAGRGRLPDQALRQPRAPPEDPHRAGPARAGAGGRRAAAGGYHHQDARGAARHLAGGAHREHRAGARRDRLRQGGHRARPPRGEPAADPGFRGRQLLVAGGGAAGERALWPRARRLHRRGDGPKGAVRRGQRRHALPGRDRRRVAGDAGQAPPRAAGARGGARGDVAPRGGGRARGGRHAPGPGGDGGGGALPEGPLLPPQGLPDPRSPAPRASGRHPGAGGRRHRQVERAHRPLAPRGWRLGRGDGAADGVRLARQRPRADGGRRVRLHRVRERPHPPLPPPRGDPRGDRFVLHRRRPQGRSAPRGGPPLPGAGLAVRARSDPVRAGRGEREPHQGRCVAGDGANDALAEAQGVRAGI
ncbi:MAG: Response regulator of zinc sigma-54-dependent two-component system, partial [uncultured Gemmatimonadetes bacterium]